MAWTLLVIAGLFEVVWAYAMKLSMGFSHRGYAVLTIVAMLVSFGLLSLAMRQLPLGTAYTVWTGIGAVGAFLAGVMILGEAVTPLRLVAAAMIVGGILLMKLASPS
ncbi:DMT family transporter [Parapedomonas caeni]|jgi:quaternary ammonium compound-resistance protein SugE